MPCPNKLTTSSNPKPQTRAEDYPSLVSTPIPEVQITPKNKNLQSKIKNKSLTMNIKPLTPNPLRSLKSEQKKYGQSKNLLRNQI
jgi:hypothetical protein